MKPLRDYQQSMISGARASLAAGFKRIVVQAPTGSGKSRVIAELCRMATGKRKRVLVMAPRRELIHQLRDTLAEQGVFAGIIMAGEAPAKLLDVQVASFDTLHARAMRSQRMAMPEADMVVVDECFVAGTIVDGRAIESIKVGDKLSTGVVSAISRKKCTAVAEVVTSISRVVCTLEHPFFTQRGWVAARDIACDDEVVSIYQERSHDYQDVQELRELFRASEEVAAENVRAAVFDRLEDTERSGCANQVREDSPKAADARQQSNEVRGNQGESIDKAARNGVGTNRKARERAWAYCSRAIDRVRSWVAGVCCSSDAGWSRQRVSELLQDRCCERGAEDRRGGQREFPQRDGAQSSGREKGGVLGVARVEGVFVHELGSGVGFGRLCPEGAVYNLEVDGSHMFFANGMLAHNCHLSISETRKDIIEHYDGKVVIGFTATPARGDGRGLGELYQDLVLGPTVRLLTDQGHLVPLRYFAPSKPDLAGIKLNKDRDYNETQLGKRMNDAKLIGDIIENWQRIAPTRRTVVFCVNVAHSKSVCAAFVAAGVVAEHLDGETPADERADILERVKNGSTQVLCNVFVASYGLDIPALDCCVLARPTKNITLYLQTVGRVLRTFLDKLDAILIDHAGAIEENGFADDFIPWSLDGDETVKERKKKAAEEGRMPKEIECGKCHTVFKGRRECPSCGNQCVGAGKPIPTHEAVLVEIKTAKANRLDTWEAKASFIGQIKTYARDHGKSDGWVAHTYRDVYGVWPNDRRVKNAKAIPVEADTAAWIKHRLIKFAKAKAA